MIFLNYEIMLCYFLETFIPDRMKGHETKISIGLKISLFFPLFSNLNNVLCLYLKQSLTAIVFSIPFSSQNLYTWLMQIKRKTLQQCTLVWVGLVHKTLKITSFSLPYNDHTNQHFHTMEPKFNCRILTDSNIAPSCPMLPLGVTPKPPIKPAHRSL